VVVDINELTSKGKVKIKNVEHLNQGALSTNFFVLATSTYKKDEWQGTINQLFTKSCGDFKLIFDIM
jgi:hypothetical protein